MIAIGLFVVYDVYKKYIIRRQIVKVGREFCEENGLEYIGIKSAKSHYVVMFKKRGSDVKASKSFKVKTFFGKVKDIEWL